MQHDALSIFFKTKKPFRVKLLRDQVKARTNTFSFKKIVNEFINMPLSSIDNTYKNIRAQANMLVFISLSLR